MFLWQIIFSDNEIYHVCFGITSNVNFICCVMNFIICEHTPSLLHSLPVGKGDTKHSHIGWFFKKKFAKPSKRFIIRMVTIFKAKLLQGEISRKLFVCRQKDSVLFRVSPPLVMDADMPWFMVKKYMFWFLTNWWWAIHRHRAFHVFKDDAITLFLLSLYIELLFSDQCGFF